MTAVQNPGFEDAGASPGEAAHWVFTAVVQRQGIAGFGPGAPMGWEDFERWHELVRVFDESAAVLAMFDPQGEGYEDFGEAWDNDVFLMELPTGHVVACAFHGGVVEDLEVGWDNVPFAWSWSDVSASPALFGGQPSERFGAAWYDNEHYAWAWTDVTSDAALFDGGASAVESFSGTWDPATTI